MKQSKIWFSSQSQKCCLRNVRALVTWTLERVTSLGLAPLTRCRTQMPWSPCSFPARANLRHWLPAFVLSRSRSWTSEQQHHCRRSAYQHTHLIAWETSTSALTNGMECLDNPSARDFSDAQLKPEPLRLRKSHSSIGAGPDNVPHSPSKHVRINESATEITAQAITPVLAALMSKFEMLDAVSAPEAETRRSPADLAALQPPQRYTSTPSTDAHVSSTADTLLPSPDQLAMSRSETGSPNSVSFSPATLSLASMIGRDAGHKHAHPKVKMDYETGYELDRHPGHVGKHED